MENTGFKGLLKTLYQRVILSWATTAMGFGVALAGAQERDTDQLPRLVPGRQRNQPHLARFFPASG